MNRKRRFTQKKLHLIASCLCILCLPVLCLLAYMAEQSSTPLILQSKGDYTPKQDEDGYYLLGTPKDFKWFISAVNHGNTEINVRLCNDLILNDTSDWESWEDTPPENIYSPMDLYNGHFDGAGFALDGYYSSFNDTDAWQVFLFTVLEEDARISDLHIRNSFFRTTYEECCYEDNDECTAVVPASALCLFNNGVIENCNVHARILGAWNAGGIVANNYGEIIDCHFSGSVEAGLAQHMEQPENRLGVHTLFAGGICCGNEGLIRNCVNDGNITLQSLPEDYYLNYAAGGIAGMVSGEYGGIIENSENRGSVTCAQLAGGIAGSSRGAINRCVNRGSVHVEEADDLEHTESLISAGICASNGGAIDTCIHTGSVTISQTILSFYAPVYGIACNIVNPGKGTITNCYYLTENTEQAYRQSGVHKLSAKDTADFSAYLDGTQKIQDIDTWDLLPTHPSYPGTDENDYIHLRFGPVSDVVYEVQPGDSFWRIAENFYGDGRYYNLLKQESETLQPGDRLTVPCIDYYLLRANNEHGHSWSYCILPSGESCPTHFIAAKPIDWYYGSMDFAAHNGFDVMWPKDKEQGHDVPASDIRIMYRIDGNPGGDFFEDWSSVQKSIRRSAGLCCKDAVDNLHFYRYTLDNGEKLYGCSFLLYRPADTLQCAAFYRIREGFLAEYIGVAPIQEKEPVLERVRYLAAEIDNVLTVKEVRSDCEAFYGKENWEFPLLHNPFTTALAYDRDAECSSYMLFTGAQ